MDDYQTHLVEELSRGRIDRRRFLQRGAIAGMSMPAMASFLAACGGGAGPSTVATVQGGKPRRGGSLTLGLYQPESTPDPVTANSSGQYGVAQVALEYLAYPRPDYTLEPRLATKWVARDPKTWDFTLRQGVTWHDGKPLRPEDVAYTFNLLADPKSGSSAVSVFAGLLSKGGVEKKDAQTVRFNLDRAFVDFPYLVSAFNYNAMILPEGYRVGDFVKGNVGTGAYILKSYTPAGATFVRNPRYWQKDAAYLDQIKTTPRAEDSALAAGLQAGEIDVYPQVAASTYATLRQASGVKITEAPSSAYREIHMRVTQPPFDDVRVRQAMALTMDRPAIIEGVLGGRGTPGNDHGFAPVFPLSKGVGSAVAQRKQDIAQAKQLLAQAGYGQGLKLTLNSGQILEVPDYLVAWKSQAKAAGVDLELKLVPAANYYGSGDKQPWLDVPFGVVDWNPRGTASQLIPAVYMTGGIWNASKWSNADFDATMKAIDAELDEQKRVELTNKAAKLMNDEVPAIISYWVTDLRATRSYVGGLAPAPNTLLDVSRMWRAA